MVSIFCRLERIGGISGKRIVIRRVENIIIYESKSFEIKGNIHRNKMSDWRNILMKKITENKSENKLQEEIRKENPNIMKRKPKPPVFKSPRDVGNVSLSIEGVTNTLKVKDESIDLDRFMEILKEQDEITFTPYNKNELNDKIVLLEYNQGEVTKFGLIKIKNILTIIPFEINKHNNCKIINLNKGNYSFELKGINTKNITKQK